MRPSIPRRACLALPILVALAGCGGSGDDDPDDPIDGTSPSGAGGNGDAPDPDGTGTGDGDVDPGAGEGAGGTDPTGATGPRFSYRTVPTADSAADFVAVADAQGAEGYRFQGPATFSSAPPLEILDVYVRDDSAPGRYTYRALPDADDGDALLAEMNAQGAEGYAFRGPLAFGASGGAPEIASVYVRDETAPAAFAYEALPIAADPDAFLERANAQGERGYRYLSPLAFDGGADLREFYVLDASAPGSFEYTVLPSPGTVDGLVAQANEQGEAGRVRRGEILSEGFGGDPLTLYVRDATRSATIGYAAVVPATSAEAFVRQAAAEGAAGRLYVGDVSPASTTGFDPDAIRSLYADVTGCDCEPLRLGDPFTN